MKPFFKSRAFGTIFIPDSLRFSVNSMTWSAIGGPSEAEVEVIGPEVDQWEMIEMLRCPVSILDDSGRAVWWGYVHAVEVPTGRLAVGATIDSMYNDVAVAYSLAQTDRKTIGYRKTTAWSSDANSLAEYGRRQFLSSQGSLSDAAATARRDQILGTYAKPQRVCSVTGGRMAGGATITCRGWWDTLGWRYASVPPVTGASYETTSATEQAVGSASTNTKVMQAVNLGGRALNALGLSVYGKKAGSPADNLVLGLYLLDDNTDAPTGSALGSVTIAGGSITTSLAWLSGTFSSEVQLDPTKDYGVQISRSGAADGTNYYLVNVNEGLGDSSGFFRIYNGSAWVARSPDADMPYIISKNNSVESTNQIRELAQTYGDFLSAIDIDAASGVMLPSYRDGDTSALSEIEALLQSGGANGRRLLAQVDENRVLRVWEEPAETNCQYKLDRHGRILSRFLDPVDEFAPPVGVWCELYDIIPGNADLSKLSSPETQFLESATWTKGGGLTPYFRGMAGPDEMFKVER